MVPPLDPLMPGQSVGIPYISQADLNSAILEHRSLAADFGVYEQQSRAGAVSGDGLLKLAPLLQSIVLLQPLCELNHAQMKAAFMELVRQDPKVDKGRYATKIWAGLRAERLCTVMNHVRRVVRDGGRVHQMMGKTTAVAFDEVHEKVLSKVLLTGKVV